MQNNKSQSDETESQSQIILNNINVAVFVSDMVTNKILYANKKLQQMYEDNTLTDKICWEALRNIEKRCEFCPIPYLLKNPGESYQWELCEGDKLFKICDSIIPWVDGRMAHLQYMVDITYDHSVSSK